MTETASGIISLPMQYAANLLASSATFQTLTGAADETAAAAFIHFGEALDIKDEEQGDGTIIHPRPRATILPEEGQSCESMGAGEWLEVGSIDILLELVVPDDYQINWEQDTTAEKKSKTRDQTLWMTNKVGAIKGEMRDNKGINTDGTAPYLNANKIATVAGPGLVSDDDEPTNVAWARIMLEWV